MIKRPDYRKTIDALRAEIYEIAASLPPSVKNRLINKTDALTQRVRKEAAMIRQDAVAAAADGPIQEDDCRYTQQQIADRYVARKAIFDALVRGREISLLNAREFKVSEMHTQIHCIREEIRKKDLPWILRDRWIESGTSGKRCKQYWLEPIDDELI